MVDQQQQQQNPDNQYIITEQGDLGLGTTQLTNEEQQKVNEQQAQYRR